MQSLSSSVLEALEAQVLELLSGGSAPQLRVLGYGEVTCVIAVDDGDARYAVKRLPLFESADEVARHVQSVESYIAELTRRGVHVVDTDARVLPRPDGRQVLYLVQQCLDPAKLGPAYFRTLDEAGARAAFARIFAALEGAVDDCFAPDGQLANWAFVGDDLIYLDVSTPFVRNADGSLGCDWTFFVRTMPPPLRATIRRQIPAVIRKYCNLRRQALDFLANLTKERLTHLIDPLLADANARLGGEPITRKAIDDYYAEDARTYGSLQAARRAHRWFTLNVMRQPYPVLLPPPMDRGI